MECKVRLRWMQCVCNSYNACNVWALAAMCGDLMQYAPPPPSYTPSHSILVFSPVCMALPRGCVCLCLGLCVSLSQAAATGSKMVACYIGLVRAGHLSGSHSHGNHQWVDGTPVIGLKYPWQNWKTTLSGNKLVLFQLMSCTCRHANKCVYVFMCVRARVCMCVCAQLHARSFSLAHINTHTYTHIHSRTHTYAYKHTHTQ